MSLYFTYALHRDEHTGRFSETRHGPRMRNLETAKARARSINGIVRDDKNEIIAQAYSKSIPLWCGDVK